MLAFSLIRFNCFLFFFFLVGRLKWNCKLLSPFISLTNDDSRRDRELLNLARDKSPAVMDPLSIYSTRYFHEQLTGYSHRLLKHLNPTPVLLLAWVVFWWVLRKTDIQNTCWVFFLPSHWNTDTLSHDSGVDSDSQRTCTRSNSFMRGKGMVLSTRYYVLYLCQLTLSL